ncbi:uncharacterized protein V6R79_025495 [Siganus canaliculatus]
MRKLWSRLLGRKEHRRLFLKKCQPTKHMWTDSQGDEDSDPEEVLCGIYESCATDLHHHPQLDSDIEAVRTLYSDSSVSIREYGSIDDVDVDLSINLNYLGSNVAEAWRINPSEPIIIRLHFSSSQYLDGPAPSVQVFQPSNTDHFWFGKQLQNILTVFLSRVWKDLTNENVVRQKRRQSWFRPRGTIKKVRARLSIFLPLARSSEIKEPTVKEKIPTAAMKLNHITSHTTSYTIKNPTGELFTYTPSGKRVKVSAVKSSAQLSTKQLLELLFSSQAIRHCKTTPTLQHGFLVQIMRYAEQRIPSLNEYCVICDERHVFQNGPMLKPAVCTRELCVFSFYTLGVMSGATEEVATGAEVGNTLMQNVIVCFDQDFCSELMCVWQVVDLLVAMCRAALQSSRKSIIFEPYPSVVDPHNPKALAFSPKRKSYDRLQKALDNILLVRRMTQGPYSEIKKQMDKVDPLAHPLLQWILSSSRSHIVKLPLNRRLHFMHTPHQFLLISSPPFKEARFQTARKLHGSTFAFHGSNIENWHSILRNGLVNASCTKLQLHGAAYGKGIYLSPVSGISFGYSEMGKGQHQMPTKEELLKKYNQRNQIKQEQPGQDRFLQNRKLNCIALCEVTELTGQMKSSNDASGSATERQSASFKPVISSSSSSPTLSQRHFRRVSRTEDTSPCPIPGLASDILHMRVKEGSKIRNLLRFATARMQGEGKDTTGTLLKQVVFTGSGRGVTKTITCVEILKRKVGGLHQVSKLFYKTVNEVWENPQQESQGITMQRTVPAICILLSKDPLDPQEPGYQPPQSLSISTEDVERRRALVRPALSSPSQPTAKRVCPHDWSVGFPQTSKF